MPKKTEEKPGFEFKGKITHVMADGTVRDSIEGYVVPYNQQTAICYELIAKYAKRREESGP
ncbi:MAG: hypothetical protein GX424_05935 [Clostridiales bacterium]|nr:hypothetical protein [Clostridiales bacterium]